MGRVISERVGKSRDKEDVDEELDMTLVDGSDTMLEYLEKARTKTEKYKGSLAYTFTHFQYKYST